MTVNFTEEELKYIDKKMFNWSIKDDCPSKLKPIINEKLMYLYDKKYKQ